MNLALPEAKSVFLHALEIDSAEERAAYLAEACQGSVELRQRVEELIRSFEQAGSFMNDKPAAAFARTTLSSPITEQPGDTIGPYKLLQQIGEGGFGVVYMAEQTEPVRRKVALKIIKPGMDTKEVIARFEAERQALALMDHPNIARVLDAGATESGRPYFVMELVKGLPITRYCDEQHLTPRDRLELFLQICRAVQHAHQKGLIHRDLKPSNILVARYDDRAVPKVIDFGVAKAISQRLTEKTMFTQYGQIVGTIEYMSPEQAQFNQLDVDTRSDIYSLGVLLYELLTGETPFDKQRLHSAAFDELLRIIREEDPPRPSVRLSTSAALASIAANRHVEPHKLSTLVRGELDWIVMKAMEKDRTRRYETASLLAADVLHYLNDEAVSACPPSAGYRLRKLARQHRAALTTLSAVALCLIVGASVSVWLAVRATRAEHAAEESFERAHLAEVEASEQRDDAEQQRRAAERESEEAQLQRDEAERQRVAAQTEQIAAQRNLVTSQFLLARIANGDGDAAGALTWYLQAYLNAPPDDPRRVSARNLIGTWGGNLKHTLVHDSGVHTIAISGDGRKLVTGYFSSRAQFWDLATGTAQGDSLPHAGDIVSAQLNTDGRFALIGDWEGAKVWDVETGQLRYPGLEHEVREDTVVGPVLSPDDRWIVTRSPFTGIRLWDAETGQPHSESLELGEFVYRMIFSPDSKRVAALGGGLARVWDVETAQPIGELLTEVTDVAFHPAGQIVAVSRNNGTLLLRDLETGEQIAELTHDSPLHSVEFDQTGTKLLTRGDGNAWLWTNILDAERTRRALPHDNLFTATFSPTSGWLLTASPLLLRVWREDAEAPQWERSVPRDPTRWRSDWVNQAYFSPDGQSLLTRTEDGTAEVLAIANGRTLARELNVLDAAFASDGKTLLAASKDGWARVFSVDSRETRRLPRPLSREFCDGSGYALSPDGSLIFVVGYTQSYIYRTDTWEPVGKPLEGLYHDWKDAVSGAAFSPDNRLLVTAMSLRGEGDAPYFDPSTTITFWDVESGEPVGEPMTRAPWGSEVAFDTSGASVCIGETVFDVSTRTVRTFAPDQIPTGHRAVSQLLRFSHSLAPRLWDDDRGGPTMVKMPRDEINQALLSADGRRLLVVGNDGMSQLYDAASGSALGPEFQAEGFANERSSNGKYTLFWSGDTLRIWDVELGHPCGDLLPVRGSPQVAFSPDGTVLATRTDFSAQLVDCATGLMLGPPMQLSSNSSSRPIFAPDGRQLYIESSGLELWRVPTAAVDDPERLRLSIEVRTGTEVGENATIEKLSQADWLERRLRLEELGGPCDVEVAALGDSP